MIDEYDVSSGLDPREQVAKWPRHLRRALTWTAGKKEEWIRLSVVTKRRQEHDLKIDRAALMTVAVLEDRQRAAIRIGGAFITWARMQTIDSRGCLSRCAAERA